MRFCPQCGAELVPEAKFCVECGERVAPAAQARAPVPTVFIAVIAGLAVTGLAAAALILRNLPAHERAVARFADADAPDNSGMPPNHPPIKIPQKAIDFINDLERRAEAKPNDLPLWDQLGDVTSRAALFDPAYRSRSLAAYDHVLKLSPDDPAALRGVGNINYDLRHYDEAIAAYEHYLKERPGDPEVLTDLGTMYLSSGNPDQAVLQYKQALLTNPKFFQAYYNLGVAYGQENQMAQARASFERALELAPDEKTRGEIKQMMASIEGAGSASAPNIEPVAATTFQGSVEQMIHALPIAGNKVTSVQWPTDSHARVMFQDFPMDSMPPFAKMKFLANLRSVVLANMQQYRVGGPVIVDLIDAASGKVMDSVAVTAAIHSGGAPSAANPAPAVAASNAEAPTPADFQGAVDQMMRQLPIAGVKVQALKWSAPTRATVLMDNFPMDSMPAFVRARFLDHVKSGLENVKRAHNVSETVQLDIADAASGRVMESVSE